MRSTTQFTRSYKTFYSALKQHTPHFVFRNKFHTSAGLVVTTTDQRVVLIKRKLPYCYENYLLRRKIPITDENIVKHIETFKSTIWYQLKEHEQRDFTNFFYGDGVCEDLYDFPHGQISRKHCRRLTVTNRYKHIDYLFATAMKEFEEETGYTFDVNEDYRSKKIYTKIFLAKDGYTYTQFYFHFQNVELKPSKRRKEHQYTTELVTKSLARELLKSQQLFFEKNDNKYYLVF